MSVHGSEVILVVEDDPDIAEAMIDVLVDEGYDVRHAANGREALSVLRSSPAEPSLILLDLMMPEMDGPQFREAQLRDPRFAAIPVVVLSADRNCAQRATELGVSGYVVKPLGPEQLVSLVARTATHHEPIPA